LHINNHLLVFSGTFGKVVCLDPVEVQDYMCGYKCEQNESAAFVKNLENPERDFVMEQGRYCLISE